LELNERLSKKKALAVFSRMRQAMSEGVSHSSIAITVGSPCGIEMCWPALALAKTQAARSGSTMIALTLP